MRPGLTLEGLESGGETACGMRVVHGGRGGSCCGRSAHGPDGQGGCQGAEVGLELALEAVRV